MILSSIAVIDSALVTSYQFIISIQFILRFYLIHIHYGTFILYVVLLYPGCARLLKSNKTARIVTLIFPLNIDNLNPSIGPPYPVTIEQYHEVLSNYGFKLEDSYMSEHSIKPRKNREMVAIWSINR